MYRVARGQGQIQHTGGPENPGTPNVPIKRWGDVMNLKGSGCLCIKLSMMDARLPHCHRPGGCANLGLIRVLFLRFSSIAADEFLIAQID